MSSCDPAAAGPGPPPPRHPVHAASGHRLGASHPRQDHPADLRLLPAAGAAWAMAALTLGTPARLTAALALAGGGAAVLVLLLSRALSRGLARPSAARHRPLLTATALALLCAAAAATVTGLHTAAALGGPLPALAAEHRQVTVELAVTADPRPARSGPEDAGRPRPLLVEATAHRVTTPDGTATRLRSPVLLVVTGLPDDAPDRRAWAELLPTTRLRTAARLAPPHPGTSRRIAAVLVADGTEPPEVTTEPGLPQRLAGRLRAGLRDATEPLPGDPRGLLPALVVGDTSRLPADLQEAVRAADMAHLIVVSGAHLTLILAVLIGRPARASRAERGGLAPLLGLELRTTALLGLGVVAGFVVLCRPGPSVLRAAVCGAIALLAVATGRRRSLLPALAAAVLLLVLYDPGGHARSFGFLLSVAATGSLLTLAPRWSDALRRRGIPARLAEGLAAAGAAQVVCAPIVVVFAGRVSLVAIPCNLLAEPAFAPATVLGWAALVLAPVSPAAAEALAWLAAWPARWIAAVARTGAGLPGAELGWPGGWAGAALLAALTVALLALGRRAVRRPAAGACAALLLLLALLRPPALTALLTGWPPPGWLLVVCDVGQGDALVVRAGEGSALVVDTGPDPRAVDRCLRELGVTHIPLLVLTHFHADHVAGLPGVLRGRDVTAIQTSPVREEPGQADRVEATAREAGIPLTAPAPGERRTLGAGLAWQVLWPPERPAGHGANDASITLLLRAHGLTVLLPGDIEPPAQQALLAAHPQLPAVDVLKVPHHGSAYQHRPLLERLRPRIALISAGADNSYGHPAPETLAVLHGLGALTLRTDRHGPIALTPGPTAVTGRGRRRRAAGYSCSSQPSCCSARVRSLAGSWSPGSSTTTSHWASSASSSPARDSRTTGGRSSRPSSSATSSAASSAASRSGSTRMCRASVTALLCTPPATGPRAGCRWRVGCCAGWPGTRTTQAGREPGHGVRRGRRGLRRRSPWPWARRSCCWTAPCGRWWRRPGPTTRTRMCGIWRRGSSSRACWPGSPALRCSPSARWWWSGRPRIWPRTRSRSSRPIWPPRPRRSRWCWCTPAAPRARRCWRRPARPAPGRWRAPG
ncbi:competence protein ComEC [Streptomyces aidingensis]|uniref:Competence protein ComEC n=1 Tax=Streptomyces aidingensis TaxID=910347 RepID=A0A1I1FKX5_9ACTN|nr:competence protein ComEC [Streptomyces aidingensis]